MSTVKTWKERLGNSAGVTACGAVGESMQDEVDELRAENSRLREIMRIVYITCDWHGDDGREAMKQLSAALGEKP